MFDNDGEAEWNANALHETLKRLFEVKPSARHAYVDAETDDPVLRRWLHEFIDRAATSSIPSEAWDEAVEHLINHIAEGETQAPQGEVRTLHRPSIPDRIGPYKVRLPLGEGAFGVVYLAEEERPRRLVAVKVLHEARSRSHSVLNRFAAERQALSMMSHNNIARAYGFGETEGGLPYIVMEYVRGSQLTTFCERLPMRERLELFLQICDAVQHAHTKGVIHRDLKPANILVTKQGHRPVPKVIDFGVAKAMGLPLTDRLIHTQSGVMIGSMQYASPEQIEGDVNVDARSDIYALGVILYQLLTDQLPLDDTMGDSLTQVIREVDPERPSVRVQRESPSSLGTSMSAPRTGVGGSTRTVSRGRSTTDSSRTRSLARELRGDLDVITMSCLMKDPAKRYSSVALLAEDIRRYMRNEPLIMRPPTLKYHVAKLARRHRGAVTFAAGGVTMLALLVVILTATLVTTTHDLSDERQRGDSLEDELTTEKNESTLDRLVTPNVSDGGVVAMDRVLADVSSLLDHDTDLRDMGDVRVRNMVLTAMARTLEEARATEPPSATLLARHGLILSRLGDVAGGASSPNKGDEAGAVEMYESSIELLEEGLTLDRGEPSVWSGLVSARLGLSETLRRSGDFESAARQANLALDAATELERLGDPDASRALRSARQKARDIAFTRQDADPDAQLTDLEAEIEALRERNDLQSRRDLSVRLGRLATVHATLDQSAPARAAFDEMIDVRRDLLAARPDSQMFRRDLAVSLLMSSSFELEGGDADRALASIVEARERVEDLVLDADPDDARVQTLAAQVLLTQGQTLAALDRTEDAAAALRRGIEISTRVIRRMDSVSDSTAQLNLAIRATLHRDFGRLRLDEGDVAGGLDFLDAAIEDFNRLERRGALEAAEAYADRADALRDLGDASRAMEDLAAAERLASRATGDRDRVRGLWNRLVTLRDSLAPDR